MIRFDILSSRIHYYHKLQLLVESPDPRTHTTDHKPTCQSRFTLSQQLIPMICFFFTKSLFFKNYFILNYMYVSDCLQVHTHECRCLPDQNRPSKLLELEFQAAVSCHIVDIGTELGPLQYAVLTHLLSLPSTVFIEKQKTGQHISLFRKCTQSSLCNSCPQADTHAILHGK